MNNTLEIEYEGPQIADYEDAVNWSLAQALKIQELIDQGKIDPFFEITLSHDPF